jgi:integrase
VESIPVEELNDFIVRLMKRGMSANTVRHNVIIVAQFFRRNGRPGLTRQLHLPGKISTLPREYKEDALGRFFGACDAWERALFSTFLLTGMCAQEVMHLCWPDVNLRLRTIRVTAKPERGFYPKRWEEREIPIASHLVNLLEGHPRTNGPFVFPSPTGNREQSMLRRVKEVAVQAGLKTEFDLKTFRSTFATRMLRAGFDVRTVLHWMGHKSLETTMRYLVPATDVHERLNRSRFPQRRHRSPNPRGERLRTCRLQQMGRDQKPSRAWIDQLGWGSCRSPSGSPGTAGCGLEVGDTRPLLIKRVF